jgi:hypothetical protein
MAGVVMLTPPAPELVEAGTAEARFSRATRREF